MSYQQKPSSELGTSLPSNTGQNGGKWPPKYGRIYDYKGAMSTTNWHLPRAVPMTEQQSHLPSASRDWTPCCYSCWPSTPTEGVQGGVRHSELQGIWGDRTLDSWMFLGTDFMISILTSLPIYRSTKSLHGVIRSSWLTKTFVKWVLHGIVLPLQQNLICWLSPTAALEQSLRAIWDAVSRAAVLILLQIKFNSQLKTNNK